MNLTIYKSQNKLIQIQSTCRQQNKCDSKIEICVYLCKKHLGKRRECWCNG